MRQKTKIRQELIKWITGYKWKYFVTLTFDKDLSEIKADKELRVFNKRLNNSLYGRRSKKKVQIAHFKEFTKDGRPHFHLLIGNTYSKKECALKTLIPSHWNKSFYTSDFFMAKNDKWFRLVDSMTQDELVDYCTKTVIENTDCLEIELLELQEAR